MSRLEHPSTGSISMLYGKTGLDVGLPDGCIPTTIAKPPMPLLTDPQQAVREALKNPVNAPPLAELARGKKSACILVCDITRPVPNGLFLPILIRELLEAGVPAEGIKVLVATGLHRPNEGAELEELIGDPWVLNTVEVLNHFARKDSDHADLGTTSKGTRVRIDRRFVEAELRIATGLVEPHFMAGYSGGRKVIAPGVAHAETITTFHNAHFMSHPRASNTVLEGNPLHEEQLEIVGMLGGAMALNTVLDDERRLALVNFGEIVQSHLQAVSFVRRYAEVGVPRRFKTVVTSAAGYPLDKTYYQTVKGMVGPLEILEPGGDLIVVSECSEGFGSREFIEAQRRLLASGEAGFLQDIFARSHAEIDEWQTQMQLRPMKVGRVHLYSPKLNAQQQRDTGVNVVTSVSQTIAQCMALHHDPQVAFVPEGPYVIPLYRPLAASTL